MDNSSIGLDGCPAGWFWVRLRGASADFGILGGIDELPTIANETDVVLVDIPIGLPSAAEPVRRCETEARRVLGPRRSSVFPVPCRAALAAKDYPAASAANQRMLGRKLSKQTWFIMDKIREVDGYLRRGGDRPRPREMHPEVCFWALNDQAPMAFYKKDGLGCAERLQVLERHWPGASALVKQARLAHPARRGLATDDIVDALAGAVSAAAPALATLPDAPARDEKDLPMEMVYPVV